MLIFNFFLFCAIQLEIIFVFGIHKIKIITNHIQCNIKILERISKQSQSCAQLIWQFIMLCIFNKSIVVQRVVLFSTHEWRETPLWTSVAPFLIHINQCYCQSGCFDYYLRAFGINRFLKYLNENACIQFYVQSPKYVRWQLTIYWQVISYQFVAFFFCFHSNTHWNLLYIHILCIHNT